MIDDLLLKIKNRKLVVIVAPIVIGIFLGFVMVIQPAMIKIIRFQADKTNLSGKATVYTNIISLEKQLQNQKERLASLGDKAQFIEALNTYAGEAGLNILSMTPDEKKAAGTYLERISVRIDAEGNYHQLADFVSRVENMKQMTRILGLEINSESGSEPAIASGIAADVPANTIRNRVAQSQSYKVSVTVGQFGALKDAL